MKEEEKYEGLAPILTYDHKKKEDTLTKKELLNHKLLIIGGYFKVFVSISSQSRAYMMLHCDYKKEIQRAMDLQRFISRV